MAVPYSAVFLPPDIVGITGGISQSVGNASRGVARGRIGGGSDIALCVCCSDGAADQVGFDGSDIAASIGLLQNYSRGSERTLLRRMDACIVDLTYGKPVDDDGFGYDIGSRNTAELGAFSGSSVFCPSRALLSIGINKKNFIF